MKYNNDEIEGIIKETSEEILLKKYLFKMNNIFGEDYTTMILSSDYDIKKSISMFSSKLNCIDNHSIQYILLKHSLLSNDDLFNQIVKNLKEENYKNILYLVQNNLCYRKILTRRLINNSNRQNMDIFNSIEDDKEKEIVVENINFLRDYARFIHVQEYFTQVGYRKDYRNNYKKVKRKGNRYY